MIGNTKPDLVKHQQKAVRQVSVVEKARSPIRLLP